MIFLGRDIDEPFSPIKYFFLKTHEIVWKKVKTVKLSIIKLLNELKLYENLFEQTVNITLHVNWFNWKQANFNHKNDANLTKEKI